jgi:hypothetical protein
MQTTLARMQTTLARSFGISYTLQDQKRGGDLPALELAAVCIGAARARAPRPRRARVFAGFQ